ncbi:MAG TPA: AlkA N-terminal domain-containing protein [Thermomicrobiales bacterium]|nr:AlkA N-terminal domain-containing protein [Thermomicrobiales bacterium]
MTPETSAIITLPTESPFNLEATVRLLQRRPTNRIDHWNAGHYRRALATTSGLRLVDVVNEGTIDAPDVYAEILGEPDTPAVRAEITSELRWILGLDADPAPVEWLGEMDARIAPVATALRGFRPPCFPTLFETCGAVIPYQQLSLDAGTAILGRVIERFGASLTSDGTTWYAFPSPTAVLDAPVDELRAAGLSRSKVSTLQKLAVLTIAGALDRDAYQSLPTAAALKQLIASPGIGPWSAGLILLRGLRRMDLFPPGDVGVARSLTALLGLETPMTAADSCTYAESFGDRRGYLYFLSLGSQLLSRGLITPAPAPDV